MSFDALQIRDIAHHAVMVRNERTGFAVDENEVARRVTADNADSEWALCRSFERHISDLETPFVEARETLFARTG